jgi:hypothetical protein
MKKTSFLFLSLAISERGTTELTAVDTLNNKISGNFEFVAARTQMILFMLKMEPL